MIETVRVALGGLAANKLRSGLTILGLMIGVGSVIVLIAVGTGSSSAVESQIESLGSNVLLVSETPTLGGLRGGAGGATSTSPLTVADATALQSKLQAPDVASASPVVNAEDVTLTYDGTTYSPSTFVGTTPSYKTAHDYTLQSGSWFTSAQDNSHARVLVVGPTVVSELFSGQSPVGRGVRAADRGAGHAHRLREHRLDHRAGQVPPGAQRGPDRGHRHPQPAPSDHRSRNHQQL
jgi:putative ABC transport system permease protein